MTGLLWVLQQTCYHWLFSAVAGERECEKPRPAEKPHDLCVFLWLHFSLALFPIATSQICPEKYKFLRCTKAKPLEAMSCLRLGMTTS